MSSPDHAQLLDALERISTEMDRRFTEVDRRFTETAHQLGAMSLQISALDDRLVALRHDMLGHFDEIYRRLERLEQEYQAITQALRRIEAGLADEQGRREILERDLAELKRHVTTLQSRIEEIEQRLDR